MPTRAAYALLALSLPKGISTLLPQPCCGFLSECSDSKGEDIDEPEPAWEP